MQHHTHLTSSQRTHSSRASLRVGPPVSRRAVLSAGLTAAGAASLAACSSKTNTQTGGKAGKTTLAIQNWFTSTDMSSWNIGLDAVKKKYPDLAFKLPFVDYNDTISKTISEATAHNLPDIIMASNNFVPALSANGILMNLDKRIKQDPSVNPDDFAPGVSQGFHLQDHWWGFPYDVSTFGIYYNTKMFKDAGVSPPPGKGETPWTWDQFVEAAQKLTDPSKKQYGVMWWGLGGNDAWDSYLASNFVYSAGGRLFSDDGHKCVVDSAETAKAVKFMIDLIHRYKVAPTPAETAGGNVDYFRAGHAAMYLDGDFSLGPRLKTVKFPFDVSYFPLDATKKLATGGSGFCISDTTKHPDEAWDFLSTFTSAPVLKKMIGETARGIPARASVSQSYSDQFSDKVPNAQVFTDELSYTFTDQSVLAYNEFVNAWQQALEPIFGSGQGDITAALNKIAQTTTAALTQKWQQVGNKG